jgi:hypothetical protein
MKTFKSDVSHKAFPIEEKISARTIRHSILNLIQKDNPHFSHESFLSTSELNFYREKATSEFLVKEIGELSELEKTVLSSLASNTTLTDKIDGEDEGILTTGQRIADKVASFGGSWKFII